MNPLISLILFLLVKYASYVGVLYSAIKILNIKHSEPMVFSLIWAFVKIAIGIPFGFAIFFIYAYTVSLGESIAYIIAFGCTRIAEWYIIYLLLSKIYSVGNKNKIAIWLAIGVVVSMLSDLAWLSGIVPIPKFVC